VPADSRPPAIPTRADEARTDEARTDEPRVTAPPAAAQPEPVRHRNPAPTAPGAGGAWGDYRGRVASLVDQYRAVPPGERVRLAKRTSNLFRPRSRRGVGLDVSGLDGVLALDPSARTAEVAAMTTYEALVDATLPYGLMPLVVPELRTITLGGALTGLGIEASSWRNGMPHESVLEIEVLTGDGRVVTARPDGEHRDLYFGFPGSYGTLGYALRARIELEEVAPWVHLRHLPFAGIAEAGATIEQVCRSGTHDGEPVAFVDGVWWGPEECTVTLGSWRHDPPPVVRSYNGQAIFYRSVRARSEDWLTTRDFLWRWDTDWFWCSRAFGAQNPALRRVLPRSLLRSDTYWKIMSFEQRFGAKGALERRLGHPEREAVVQDVEVPLAQLESFLDGLAREVPITPVWICPLRSRDPMRRWPLYDLDAGTLWINLGIWSSLPLRPGMDPAHHNRWIESEVDRLGGRKSLYSTAFYDEERFYELYGGADYRQLRATYDPDGRLLDLYQKCVLRS